MRVLTQGWMRPFHDEAAILGLAARERALVREVLLLCNGRPWVYARSVFPADALRGPYRRLAHLGNRPLGEILFARRGTRRRSVMVHAAEDHPRLLARCAAALERSPRDAWLRSSVFGCAGHALLVSEIFLEAFAHD